MRRLEPQSVYVMAEDFWDYDSDGDDEYKIMHPKGSHVFITEEGFNTSNIEANRGYYATVIDENHWTLYGPAGTKSFIPCIGERLNLDITKPEDEAQILLLLNGNTDIYKIDPREES